MRILGANLVGLGGLMGHILGLLTLAEPGYDAACAYALYEPLSQGDDRTCAGICSFLEKKYRRTAVLTFLLGMAGLPLLFLTQGGEGRLYESARVYLLSLTGLSLSYLYSHRRILPATDQKGYIVTTFRYVFFILTCAMRIAAVYFTGSFTLYLLAGLVFGFFEDLCLAHYVEKRYPYLLKEKRELPFPEKEKIFRRIPSLFLSKVGGIIGGSADNLAVFFFLGLFGGTVYSNYTMLFGSCASLISLMTAAVSSGVGDMEVSGSREHSEKVYRASFFCVFFAASFLSLSLYFVCPSFMALWMSGSKEARTGVQTGNMLLGKTETLLFCVFFFLSALRRPTGIFLDGCGLFEKEKYKSLLEGVLCALLVFFLTPRFGIAGVLAGQIASALLVSFWYEPKILYRYGFKMSVGRFWGRLPRLFLALAASAFLSFLFCRFLPASFPAFLLRIPACLAASAVSFGLVFAGSDDLRLALYYVCRVVGTAEGGERKSPRSGRRQKRKG